MLPRPVLTVGISAVCALFLLHQIASRGDAVQSVRSRFGWSSHDSIVDTGPVSLPETFSAVQNDTLGFEKIFVLNLPERTDKRDFMSLAAAYSNLTFDYWFGVKGAEVPTKALPEGHEERPMGEAPIGSWRGHMNIIREVVEKRLSSALILEDDMDWDIRIKDQIPDFARGTRTFYNASDDAATHSPYGDGWDVLWLGKCNEEWKEDRTGERQIFVVENDETVPLLQNMSPSDGREMLEQLGLGDHTRIVHRVEAPICTFAYAVSYEGARKILYSLSVGGLAWNFDNSLGWWCTDEERTWNQECIGVTPTLFSQHRIKSGKVSKNSDNFEEQGFSQDAYTRTIRTSVKNNIEQLIRGRTDYADSYPDDMEPWAPDAPPPPPPPAEVDQQEEQHEPATDADSAASSS